MNDQFLAGYAAAQAVPGPLFAFSAYLSAIHIPLDFALALFAFVLLVVWKVHPWLVVVICALLGAGVYLLP